MNLRTLTLYFLLAALNAGGSATAADAPSYLLLKAPAADAPQHPSHSRYPGYGFGVQTQAYSYGWFGVPPRRHWSRHFGTYRNVTEWSAK